MPEPVVTFLVSVRDRSVADVICDQLWAAGVQAIEEIASRDDVIRLRSSFGVGAGETHERLERLFAGREGVDGWHVSEVDATVADTWKSFMEIVEISPRLRIVPGWIETPSIEGVIDARIDPAATFGMGDHPTTRGVLKLLCDLVTPGDMVLDVGCGSGILGIVSILLGANHALGVDINPASIAVSHENARRNSVESKWSVTNNDLSSVDESFDVVVANILAPVLVELAEDLKRVLQPRGVMVISGVLTDRFGHVLDALAPLRIVDSVDIDGWITLALRF